MWRSELLNLPGCTTHFGDVFVCFVRVPLTGSLPFQVQEFMDHQVLDNDMQQSKNCSSTRTSNLVLLGSETAALHLPLFDELASHKSDAQRYLMALLFDETSKAITHIRTRAPARLYASNWPYMVALQDYEVNHASHATQSSPSGSTTNLFDKPHAHKRIELQPELLEVMLFEAKAESCRFLLPLNFKRGTTLFLILIDAGIFLITRRKIYFVSYSSIVSSTSLSRPNTLIVNEPVSLLPKGAHPLYDANFCKSSGTALVISNRFALRVYTWDAIPVLCASGRVKVLEPSFPSTTPERAHLFLDWHPPATPDKQLIVDIRLSPSGTLLLVQTDFAIYYCRLPSMNSSHQHREALNTMRNLCEEDPDAAMAFMNCYSQLSLLLHVTDDGVVIGAATCVLSYRFSSKTQRLGRIPDTEKLDLTQSMPKSSSGPGSDFVSMFGFNSVIPMHVTVNGKGGVAVWDLEQPEPEKALLAHAQLPLGALLDAYWMEHTGEIHFVVMHKERVVHKWVALRHWLSRHRATDPQVPIRADWSDALSTPILYEGSLKVRDFSGATGEQFVERWFRLRPFVLFVYHNRCSNHSRGVYLLDPHIRLYRDGVSTRFTLVNGKSKYDFEAPNTTEADRVVHALLYQLSSPHSLSTIWTIPYPDAITYIASSPGASAKMPPTGTLLSTQPVVLKDHPTTYPSTEFLMLTILEHPSIIPLIGLMPHSRSENRPLFGQTAPSIEHSLYTNSADAWKPVKLVLPQQLLDLAHLIELLTDMNNAWSDDSASESITDDSASDDIQAMELEQLRKLMGALGPSASSPVKAKMTAHRKWESSNSSSSASSSRAGPSSQHNPLQQPLKRPRTVPTGSIPWRTVLRILTGLAQAISTLHHFEFNGTEVPIAHRDIKCENVLLQATSVENCVLQSRCKAVLADFEHAIFIHPLSSYSSNNLAHFSDNPHIIRNSAKMHSSSMKKDSREEIVGDERYRDPDETATLLMHDVYCFGLVAWQLISLHPLPYGKSDAVAYMSSVPGLSDDTLERLRRWCAPKGFDRPTIDGVIADLGKFGLDMVVYGKRTTPLQNPKLNLIRKFYSHERVYTAMIKAFVRDFPDGRKLKLFTGAPNTGKSTLLKMVVEMADIANFLPIVARAPFGRSVAFGVLLDLASDLYSPRNAEMPHMLQPSEHEESRLINFLISRNDSHSTTPSLSWPVLRSLFTRATSSGVRLLFVIDDMHNLDRASLHGLAELLQQPLCFAIGTSLSNISSNTPLHRVLAPFMTDKASIWDSQAGSASIFFQQPSPGAVDFAAVTTGRSSPLIKKQSSGSSDPKRAPPSIINHIKKGQFVRCDPDDDSIAKVQGVLIWKSLNVMPVPSSRQRSISTGSDSSMSSGASSSNMGLGGGGGGGGGLGQSGGGLMSRTNLAESSPTDELTELAIFGMDIVGQIFRDRVLHEGVMSATSTKWPPAWEYTIASTLGIPGYVIPYIASIEDMRRFGDDVWNRRFNNINPRYSITLDARYLWAALPVTFRHKLIIASFLDYEFTEDDIAVFLKKLGQAQILPTLAAPLSGDVSFHGDWVDQPQILSAYLKTEDNGRFRFVSDEVRRFVRSEVKSPLEFTKACVDVIKALPITEMNCYQQMLWEMSLGIKQPKGQDSDVQHVNALLTAATITAGTEVQQQLFENVSVFLMSPLSLRAVMEHHPDILITLCLELEHASLVQYALRPLEVKIDNFELPQAVQEDFNRLKARLFMKSTESSRFHSATKLVLDYLQQQIPLIKPRNRTANGIEHQGGNSNGTEDEAESHETDDELLDSNDNDYKRQANFTLECIIKSLTDPEMNQPRSSQAPSVPSGSTTPPMALQTPLSTQLQHMIQEELPAMIDHLALYFYPSAIPGSAQHTLRATTSSRRPTISSSRTAFAFTSPLPKGPLSWSYGPIDPDIRPDEDSPIEKTFTLIETILYLSHPAAADYNGLPLQPLVVLYLFITYAFRKTICPYMLINCAAVMGLFPSISLQLFQLAWSLLNDWPLGFEKLNLRLPFSGGYATDPDADCAEIKARSLLFLCSHFLYRMETPASAKKYLDEARKIAETHPSEELLAEVQLASWKLSLFLGARLDLGQRSLPMETLYGHQNKHTQLLQTFYLCSQALNEPRKAEELAPILSNRRKRFSTVELPSIDEPILFTHADEMSEEVIDYLTQAHTTLLLGETIRTFKSIRRAFMFAILKRPTRTNRSQLPSFTVIYIAALVCYVASMEYLRSSSKLKKERLKKTIDANASFLLSCAPITTDPSTASARIFGTFAFHTCGLIPTVIRLVDTIKLMMKVLATHARMVSESPLIAPSQMPTLLHHYNTSIASILPMCIEGMSRTSIKTLACLFGELGMKLGFLSSTHHVTQFTLLASSTYDCYADLHCQSRLHILETSPSFVPYLGQRNSFSAFAPTALRREISPSDYARMFVDIISSNPELSGICVKLLRDALDIAERKPIFSLPKVLGGGYPDHVVYGLAGIQQVVQLLHDRIDYEVLIRPEQAVRSATTRAVFVQFILWCILAFEHANREVNQYMKFQEVKLFIGFLEHRPSKPLPSSILDTESQSDVSWTSYAPSVPETTDVTHGATIHLHEEELPETMDLLLVNSTKAGLEESLGLVWSPLPDHLAQFLRPLMPHIHTITPIFRYFEAFDTITRETKRALRVTWRLLRPLKFSEPRTFIIVSDHEKKALLQQSIQAKYGYEILMLRSPELLWSSPKEASHVLIHESCWDDSFTPLLEVHQSRHPTTIYVFVSERASTQSRPMFHISSFRHNVANEIESFHAQPVAPPLLSE